MCIVAATVGEKACVRPKIKPIALTVVELSLAETISQSVIQLVENSVKYLRYLGSL